MTANLETNALQVLVVDFRIKFAHVADFAAAIAANARASLADEPGCRRFDVCRDPADPQRFFLYEVYDHEAAVKSHLESPHFLQMDADTRDWVESKQLRRLRLA